MFCPGAGCTGTICPEGRAEVAALPPCPCIGARPAAAACCTGRVGGTAEVPLRMEALNAAREPEEIIPRTVAAKGCEGVNADMP